MKKILSDKFRTYLHAQPNYCEYKDNTPNKCDLQFTNFKRIVTVVSGSHAEYVLLGLTEEMPNVGFMLFDTNQTLPFVSSSLSNHFLMLLIATRKLTRSSWWPTGN